MTDMFQSSRPYRNCRVRHTFLEVIDHDELVRSLSQIRASSDPALCTYMDEPVGNDVFAGSANDIELCGLSDCDTDDDKSAGGLQCYTHIRDTATEETTVPAASLENLEDGNASGVSVMQEPLGEKSSRSDRDEAEESQERALCSPETFGEMSPELDEEPSVLFNRDALDASCQTEKVLEQGAPPNVLDDAGDTAASTSHVSQEISTPLTTAPVTKPRRRRNGAARNAALGVSAKLGVARVPVLPQPASEAQPLSLSPVPPIDVHLPLQSKEPSPGQTTVMLQHLPNSYSRTMLLDMIDSAGFAGQYDFVYLPIDFLTRACYGYTFINFLEPAQASRFWSTFDGFTQWVLPSKKTCEAFWSKPFQGLEANISRYRNSPVMHEGVPDCYKPVLFVNGVRGPFPPPTKKLRMPRLRNYTPSFSFERREESSA